MPILGTVGGFVARYAPPCLLTNTTPPHTHKPTTGPTWRATDALGACRACEANNPHIATGVGPALAASLLQWRPLPSLWALRLQERAWRVFVCVCFYVVGGTVPGLYSPT